MKQCPHCLNTDPSLFSLRKGEVYCRACIGFLGRLAETQEIEGVIDPSFDMGFKLTKEQQAISNKLTELGLKGDVLVEAVCGAGKTEIVLELITKALSNNLKVGWMVARRQVVLQLGERLQSMFKHLKVVCVIGGQSDTLNGDLIILTAHQLYRYPHTFDLMIVDEPDAYPFKNNKLLHGILKVSIKGTKVYLTATPDQSLSYDYHLLLEKRPHNRKLVIPTIYKGVKSLMILKLFRLVSSLEKTLVFVPTIKEAHQIGRLLRVPVITSQSENKEEIIKEFDSTKKALVTTTILERGVTFHGVSVIVFNGGHPIFEEATLVQIMGRVDRSFTYQKGECYILCHSYNKAIDDCINRLKRHNQNAFGV